MSAVIPDSAAAEQPPPLPQPLAVLAEQLSKGSEASDADFVGVQTSLATVKVAELKEIAKFLDVRLTGATKKADIVERLVSMFKIGLAGAADASSSGASVGLQYITQDVRGTLSSSPRFNEVQDWCKEFRAAVKRFHFMDLLTYLVYGRDKTFDMESMKAFRSLKASQFFADGFVKNVWSKQYPASGENGVAISYLRAYVHHSLSCDTPLTVYVSLNTETGEVYAAQCSCIAGLGEACNHVAALLFFIESAAKRNLVELPVELSKTSQPMRWNQPPKKHVDPQPLANMEFVKACHGMTDDEVERKQLRAEFDPRAPSHRQVTSADALTLQEALAAGKASAKNCGFFHFWEVEDQSSGLAATSVSQPKALSPLVLFHSDRLPGGTSEDALGRYTGPLSKYGVSQKEVEDFTKGQTDNSWWFDLRHGRLTSSRFGDIVRSRAQEPVSLLAGIMGYTTISALPPAMRWGVENEPRARDMYLSVALEDGKNITVRECGLSLHRDYHFIGASSDGPSRL
ncbi:uncharacterized protein LOC135817518 [Sycon ciliatum]|uniref:uncharacterized protein LOC135817518 n=1 Tax=Sycon ciliatum TaxID=27933 RepID=UPI0031F71B0A